MRDGILVLAISTAVALGFPLFTTHRSSVLGSSGDCNRSEVEVKNCWTHAHAPAGEECKADAEYRIAYLLSGQLMDVYAGDEIWVCTENWCQNHQKDEVEEGGCTEVSPPVVDEPIFVLP